MAELSRHYSAEFKQWLNSPAANQSCGVTDFQLPVLVVGAGPAGLACMAELRKAGIKFEAVESHSRVGGIWDQTNPISSVYEGLHTVTSRFTSHLGQPMPSDWPDFLPASQVHKYFSNFAESEGVLSQIQLETRYVAAEKTDAGTWKATLQRVSSEESYQQEFRAIVFATGSYNRQHTKVPQSLRDQAVASGVEVIHSADYRSPAPFADKRVLVLGIGNSGTDIAEKICSTAKRTLLAVRTSPWIIPQTLGGVPCDKLAADPSMLPDWLTLRYFLLARRLCMGSNRQLGLDSPRHSINDLTPVTDRGFVEAIRDGRIVTRSNVTDLSDGVAQFSDPRHEAETIDAVIFATGFSRKYPLLDNENSDATLFHLFHRQEPGLAYMTELIGVHSCWPIFVEQAKAIAAYFSAEESSQRRVEEFNTRRSCPSPSCKGNRFCLADEYHLDYEIYTRLLHDFVSWLGEGG